MIVKTFQYKDQMINYYNKVVKNPKIEFASCSFNGTLGYVVKYWYK